MVGARKVVMLVLLVPVLVGPLVLAIALDLSATVEMVLWAVAAVAWVGAWIGWAGRSTPTDVTNGG